MRIKQVNYDDDGVKPKELVVVMSTAEAVAIATVFGRFNHYAQVRLGIQHEGSIYDVLIGFFNRHWDNGVGEVLYLAPGLDWLNNRIVEEAQ